MPSSVPTSKWWTLRLKRGKKTILVFADPAQSLRSLKQNLIDALKATNPSDKIDGQVIPPSPSEVELAKPIDQLDISQGWTLLDPPSLDDELGPEDTHNKGKSRAKSKSRDPCLKELGIKENHVLAFRFREPESDDSDETLGDDPGWKVEIPVYEDICGVENAGDLGLLPEFRG
jgi:hypothetical protein